MVVGTYLYAGIGSVSLSVQPKAQVAAAIGLNHYDGRTNFTDAEKTSLRALFDFYPDDAADFGAKYAVNSTTDKYTEDHSGENIIYGDATWFASQPECKAFDPIFQNIQNTLDNMPDRTETRKFVNLIDGVTAYKIDYMSLHQYRPEEFPGIHYANDAKIYQNSAGVAELGMNNGAPEVQTDDYNPTVQFLESQTRNTTADGNTGFGTYLLMAGRNGTFIAFDGDGSLLVMGQFVDNTTKSAVLSQLTVTQFVAVLNGFGNHDLDMLVSYNDGSIANMVVASLLNNSYPINGLGITVGTALTNAIAGIPFLPYDVLKNVPQMKTAFWNDIANMNAGTNAGYGNFYIKKPNMDGRGLSIMATVVLKLF
jgi:hypothetical protein